MGTAHDPVVEVEGICVEYGGVRVLQDITLSVSRGDFLGILGPNGSGKTTLLKVMVGLVRPACGAVKLFGVPISRFREWTRVGYVPQKAGIDLRFPATVAEVVASGRVGRAGLLSALGPADWTAVERALDVVGMAPHRGAMLGELSGGHQQRVFIARALVTRPDLLILDEPLVGVDAVAQEEFYALLRRLRIEFATTLILVSHDIGVVASEVPQLACLNRELVFHGSPQEFFDSGALAKVYRPGVRIVSHVH